MDNFYNEPPFAERLLQLSEQGAIPDTVKEELVTVVVRCACGNRYGVSRAAVPYYHKMIQGFSPSEVELMLGLPDKEHTIKTLLEYPNCRDQFKTLVSLIDTSSVPKKSASAYKSWLQ